MLVTREADYAVRCVVEVARAGRTSAAQVARVQGISPTFLGKIVQSLARAGILATRRGVGGGISLARAVEDITLLQVIEAVDHAGAVHTFAYAESGLAQTVRVGDSLLVKQFNTEGQVSSERQGDTSRTYAYADNQIIVTETTNQGIQKSED